MLLGLNVSLLFKQGNPITCLIYVVRLRGPAGRCRLEWGDTFGICNKSLTGCQKIVVILV